MPPPRIWKSSRAVEIHEKPECRAAGNRRRAPALDIAEPHTNDRRDGGDHELPAEAHGPPARKGHLEPEACAEAVITLVQDLEVRGLIERSK